MTELELYKFINDNSNKIMDNLIEDIDAECNICKWKGLFVAMEQPIDVDDVHRCPICGTENVYYLNQPPRYEEDN